MLKSLFKKKSKVEEIFSPLTGERIELEKVPDPVFSQKMMGDGFAVIPSEGKVTSPVIGEIIQVFPTKHAIGIKSKEGLEILIHVGLETVALKGEGFKVFVKEGQTINVGDPLLEFDIPFLINNNKEIVTPVIITNGEKVKAIEVVATSDVSRQDLVLTCQLI